MNIRIVGEIVVLEPNGEMTTDNGSRELNTTVRELIESGQSKILLNLHSISHADSRGIEALLSAYDTAANDGGRLKFFNLNSGMQYLLSMTKLSMEFDIYPDERKAMSSLT